MRSRSCCDESINAAMRCMIEGGEGGVKRKNDRENGLIIWKHEMNILMLLLSSRLLSLMLSHASWQQSERDFTSHAKCIDCL